MRRILHIATVAEWDQARRQGRYTTSTCGRTLGALDPAAVVQVVPLRTALGDWEAFR